MAAILDVTDYDVAQQTAAPELDDPETFVAGGSLAVGEDGVALPSRGLLDFQGAGVALSDDAASDRTVVSIAGGGGGGGTSVIAESIVSASSAPYIDGLAGDTERAYRVILDGFVNAGSDAEFGLRVNDDTASSYRSYYRFIYTSGVQDYNPWPLPFMVIGRTGFGAGGKIIAEGVLGALTDGHQRIMDWRSVLTQEPSGNMVHNRGVGVWMNAADEITKLGLILPAGATFTGRIAALAV